MDEGAKIKPVFTPTPFYGYLAMAQILADVDFELPNNIVVQRRAFQRFRLQLGILCSLAKRIGAMHQRLVCQNFFCFKEMES